MFRDENGAPELNSGQEEGSEMNERKEIKSGGEHSSQKKGVLKKKSSRVTEENERMNKPNLSLF